MPATNRGLLKRNPLIFPRDPVAKNAPPENEPYALGCDARNDGQPIDENPYEHDCADHQDWARGWADEDRALDEDDDEEDWP